MKLILDYVPNHTSIQNQDFVEEVESMGVNDKYIWQNGDQPPGCALGIG